MQLTVTFQSTPSAWRETQEGMRRNQLQGFQSTPSAWRETSIQNIGFYTFTFQSTPSAWRETQEPGEYSIEPDISIHSLRMEGDPKQSSHRSHTHISIHSLRMEGDKSLEGFMGSNIKISIHSLRMEGDSGNLSVSVVLPAFQSTPSAWRETWRKSNEQTYDRNFNPLPPHGGRHFQKHHFPESC